MLPDAVSSVLRRKSGDRNVLSIVPDASVYEAIALMAENSIGALLVVSNGTLVGISAGIGMYVVARAQHNPQALMLSFVVVMAMIGSCVVSGLAGALIPLTLKKLGADPATASSIFLTTATDVASMGLFLSLATLLVL